jgi:hypothetical protein
MGEMWLEGSEGVLRLDGRGRIWRRGRGPGETEVQSERSTRGFAGDCVYRLRDTSTAAGGPEMTGILLRF